MLSSNDEGRMAYYNNMGVNQPGITFGPGAQRRVARGCGLGGMIACLVALGVLAIPLFLVGIPAWQVRAEGVSTVGTATLTASCGTTEDEHGNPGPETYEVTIRFNDQSGQLHKVESHWACNNFYNNGEQVSLWYLPNDPSRFLTSGEAVWLYITSALWAIITFVVVLIFVLLAGALLRRRRASAYSV